MFPCGSPESVGVRSEGIVRFLGEMEEKRLHLHAMMILRHGKCIAKASFAPWSTDNLHMLFSLSKSFTSTAVGFAVQDGLISVTDRLMDFFPEYLPAEPCANMQKMTLKHLLTMNTGHREEPMRFGSCWEETFLKTYVEFEPGTHFVYNTFATYMLSAVVQKVTGKKLLAYLHEKLMDPLGMSGDITFEESPTGVATGGYGLNVRVEDIAKLGQFYLDGGRWEGKQLLNEDWIRDAVTPWSDNSAHDGNPSDWGSGYGYQFWMCKPDRVFRGDGAFGQYCVVMPEQDMVIAINSGVSDMGAVLDSIWKNILPCVGEGPLPEADASLAFRIAAAKTPARWEEDPAFEVAAPEPEESWLGCYRLQDDNSLRTEEVEIRRGAVLTKHGETEILWPLSFAEWTPAENEKAAVRAAKTKDGLLLHICYVTTPFEALLELNFTAHGIVIRERRNVGFGGGSSTIIGYRK